MHMNNILAQELGEATIFIHIKNKMHSADRVQTSRPY